MLSIWQTQSVVTSIDRRDWCTTHLLKRGYNSDIINNAFTKFSDIRKRKELYSEKSADKDESVKCTPLVMDNNPALPQVGKYMKNVIKPSSVLVSYRENKTIGEMLIHNRYRSSLPVQSPMQQAAVVEPQDLVTTPGCMACRKC